MPPPYLDHPLCPADVARHALRGYHLHAPRVAPSAPIMDGRFEVAELRSGLFLQVSDLTHLYDMNTEAEVEESVKVLLKLEGSAEVRLDRHPLDLDTGSGPGASPRGAVVALAGPAHFERRCRAGSRERMVALTLTPAWFAAGGAGFERPSRFAIHAWVPSPRAVAVAEQLLRPAAYSGFLQSLHLESRCLELVAEAFAAILPADEPDLPPGLRPGDQRRVFRLKQFLDSGSADFLGLDELARHMGSNPNSLQRHFRQAYGRTIFDYLRDSRLKRAALALEKEGISVARAAEIAGYASQANFSTAFRRRFGISPKQARLAR